MSINRTFDAERLFVQGKGNIVSDMSGEKVMLSVSQGKYFNLGTVGGQIWDHLQSPSNVVQITASLMNEYEVEYDICEREVLEFMAMLYDKGLIIEKDREYVD